MLAQSTELPLRLSEAPVIFIGDPRTCVGFVEVHNPNKTPVRLRRVYLRGAAPLALACESDGAIEARVSRTLCPGATETLRLALRLAAGTPPGSYQAELSLGGCAPRAVTVQVLERRRARISPAAISCAYEPGSTHTLRVHVQNLGNVATVIPVRAALELHEGDRGWPNHFHSAARAAGELGHVAFLDAFTKRLSKAEPPVGRAKVRSGAGPLDAQQSRLVELEIRMPKKLRAGRRYRGVVRLAGALLHLLLDVPAHVPMPATTSPG